MISFTQIVCTKIIVYDMKILDSRTILRRTSHHSGGIRIELQDDLLGINLEQFIHKVCSSLGKLRISQK